jgi:uncharacterized protein involved in exopolysaccharide biosynthesis
MTEKLGQAADPHGGRERDDEATLLDYWRVIRKRWKMIAAIVIAAVIGAVLISLLMRNVYQARAVIMPVTLKDGGAGGAAGLAALAPQFGGLLPVIAMPGSSAASEIVSLLKSNILREKLIKQHNLMPVLFFDRWDAQRQIWKKVKETDYWLNPRYYASFLDDALAPILPKAVREKAGDVPDTWDALRMLDEIIRISQDVKQSTITISADFPDPAGAARIVDYLLATLTNHMSSEAKRVAKTNRKYLEEQLGSTTDPFIKQKTYNMIAQQIETVMMAEVKENFAFKVIDPPMAPDTKIKPKRMKIVMLSFFAALFVGIVASFFREYLGKMRLRQ